MLAGVGGGRQENILAGDIARTPPEAGEGCTGSLPLRKCSVLNIFWGGGFWYFIDYIPKPLGVYLIPDGGVKNQNKTRQGLHIRKAGTYNFFFRHEAPTPPPVFGRIGFRKGSVT